MIPLGNLVNAAGGLLFVVFGAWIASLRPRRRRTLAFAAFCAFFGLAFTTQNLFSPELPPGWNQFALVFSGLAAVPAGAAILLVAHDTPHPLARTERGLLLLPAVVLLGFPLGYGVVLAVGGLPPTVAGFFLGLDGPYVVLSVGVQFLFGAQWAAAMIMALRCRRLTGEDPAGRRELAVMSSAVTAFPAFFFGTVAVLSPDYTFRLMGLAGLAAAVVTSALWLAAVAAGGGPGARNAALAPLAFGLFGVAFSFGAGGFVVVDGTGVYGFVRVAAVGMLAYAILRHHILGIDVKVRWTISKSTVAATFIAVFFIASETAQQFFGETLQSTYLGITAAGALVFALAPLQRAAERLAARAIPVAADAGPVAIAAARSRREEAYSNAIRVARRDGAVSREEAGHLHRLAEELGIGAGRAHELWTQAEDDAAAKVRRH
jgi:hypothetical protein